MANKIEVVEKLVESFGTHDFSAKELSRFAGECAAEVNGANSEGFIALCKTATISKKGVTLKANSLKIPKSAVSLRIAAFVALMNAQAVTAESGFEIRADITAICGKLREAWERKDKLKASETPAPAPAPAPEPQAEPEHAPATQPA